ncbi:MAG: hypothetical protein U0800_16315 [Isosphaeraceae bacterium]
MAVRYELTGECGDETGPGGAGVFGAGDGLELAEVGAENDRHSRGPSRGMSGNFKATLSEPCGLHGFFSRLGATEVGRWELPVFFATSVATWLAIGCYRFSGTISKGAGYSYPYSFRVFDFYLRPSDSAGIIMGHLLVSLIVGLLAWVLGFVVQAVVSRRRPAFNEPASLKPRRKIRPIHD